MPRLLSAFRSGAALLTPEQPLQAAYYRSRRMATFVARRLQRVRPDVVYTHLFRMAPYALAEMRRRRSRWILDLTDVISEGIARSLPFRRGPNLWLYREEGKRIARYEAAIAPRFDETWVISEAERRCLVERVPAANVRVVPNGTGLEPTAPRTERPRAKLLFLGFHEVFHNRDAVRFLVSDVFPRIRAEVPDATLEIAGKGAEALGGWARGEGVRVVGHVPRVDEALAQATVFVAPHRFAAGVQNKVVQALAAGLPVVTTSIVRQGLDPVPDGILSVGDDAASIASKTVELLRHPDAASLQAERARDWAISRFTWRTSLEAFESASEPRTEARPTALTVAGV
jgi:glycosyltransferase involved in cell wall biosynthesis